jgi:membrane protein YdbS with pleckstrin-like domain
LNNDDGGWNRSAQPTWFRVAGILLTLPIGLIVAFVLFYFIAYGGELFPGEFFVILLIAIVAFTVVRLLFRRERRRYLRERQV